MWKRIKRWWDAEGALVGLQGASDRMLADMGLERETLRSKVLAHSDITAPPETGRRVATGRPCAET